MEPKNMTKIKLFKKLLSFSLITLGILSCNLLSLADNCDPKTTSCPPDAATPSTPTPPAESPADTPTVNINSLPNSQSNTPAKKNATPIPPTDTIRDPAATTPAPTDNTSFQPNTKIQSFNLGILKAPGQKTSYLDVAKNGNGNAVAAFIIQIINFLTLSIGSLSLLLLIVGGVVLVSSAGNENQVTKGKDIIKWAIIGLVITLSSYYIVAFVQSLFFEK
jgi:hypothetical protein